MILFIQNEQGQYTPATSKMIIKEGRCRTRAALKKGTDYIGSTEDAKEAISTLLIKKQYEVFGCLFLDCNHRIIKWREMFFGTIDSTVVHPREVVKEALRVNAASVVLAHNHPSCPFGKPAYHEGTIAGKVRWGSWCWISLNKRER